MGKRCKHLRDTVAYRPELKEKGSGGSKSSEKLETKQKLQKLEDATEKLNKLRTQQHLFEQNPVNSNNVQSTG